jgi:toxin-antitoxin system PIN domain toxin
VIAIDTNVLVAAHRADSPQHDEARRAIEGLVTAGQRFGIPWACAHEFFAVVTQERIWRRPSTPAEALDQLRAWFEAPTCTALAETSVHLAHLASLVESGRVVGARIHDARIAAVCLQHGVTELWTADRDFGRFPQLRVRNPLVG